MNYLGDQTGRNVYGINLITRQVGADTFIYMYNGHADVTALLDTTGNVAATYYYDAFGNILDQTGTVNNNILYAGYQYDTETGLYYLNARMYDPVTARFMQEDTYTEEYNDPLSLNLYTYCKNEPIRYSDPTGHRQAEGTETGGHTTHREISRTEQDYAYQKKTKSTQSSQSSRTADDYEYQKRTKNTKKDNDIVANLLDSNSSVYLDAGKYEETLDWLDQERINRGGSISLSSLQTSITDPKQKGYNQRDLAVFAAINKLTCFNGATTDLMGLQNTLENRYSAMGADSGNVLLLDTQAMTNLGSIAAGRNQAVSGGEGYGIFKFQEEHLFASGLASTFVTGFAYGAMMTTYAGSGPQQTSQTNSDIIDAEIATGNVEYAKTMNAMSAEEWAAMPGSGGAGTTLYHSANPNVVNSIVLNGFRTDLPSPQQAFHNNRFGSGVYLSDSPITALAERPGGTVLQVQADLGKILNVTDRGIIDYNMGQAIARGARKHGFDSITFNSAQNDGGINTVVFDPSNIK